jgi:hypothetical protein
MENERQKIITAYHAAVGSYKHAVSRLAGLNGPQFEDARKDAERARELCEQTRAKLEKLDRRNGSA